LDVKAIDLSKARITEANTLLKEQNDIADDAIKKGYERLQQEKEELDLIERQQAAIEATMATALIIPGFDSAGNENTDAPTGPFDAWSESWDGFFTRVTEQSGTISDTVGTMAEILQDAFQGVVHAIGSVIQQWVLYGKTGPAIMRQILAAALATIAAESAVHAIEALALGFYRLAQHDYGAAGQAFTSAAIFGSVAGAAAIAGRVIAGNSFNQQAQASTGGASGGGSGVRSSGGGGGVYSSQDDATVAFGRNTPQNARQDIYLHLQSNDSHIVNVVKENVSNNGDLRVVIQDNATV
jgi:hypothetical protein